MPYDQLALMRAINQNAEYVETYMEKCREYCKEIPFDKEGVEKALGEMYELISAKSPLIPVEYKYDKIPDHDEFTLQFQRMINLLGYRGFMQKLVKLTAIKKAEAQNGGFDGQVSNWTKIGEAINKLSSINAMS